MVSGTDLVNMHRLPRILFLLFGFLLSYLRLYSQEYPQRIISLGSTLTEELYLLGVEDKLVGVTVYCQRPPQAKMKEKIGTIKEVNLEKIIRLKPDLVLATSLTHPKTKEKLKILGIKVVEFSYAKNFEQICAEFLKLARLVGKEEEAEKTIQQVKTKVGAIKDTLQGLSHPKVFVQIGAKPLYTANQDSFINDFIESAAGTNIAFGAQSGLYSREKVIKDNPDVIIIATMGIVGEREKAVWSRYKSLNAARNNRIYILDSTKLCSPTPVTFLETLEEIVEIFHPER